MPEPRRRGARGCHQGGGRLRRAKQAVALHLLRQLEWLTPLGLEELEDQVLIVNPGVNLEVQGALSFSKVEVFCVGRHRPV